MKIKKINFKTIKEFILGTSFPISLSSMGYIEVLDRKRKASDTSLDMNRVLRLNSSFLEITDAFFVKQGWFLLSILFFAIVFISFFCFLCYSLFIEFFSSNSHMANFSLIWNIFSVAIIICLTIFSGVMGIVCTNLFLAMTFTPGTHTPIRFCRKTQRVYGFVRLPSLFIKRPKLFNAAWKDTHFYLIRSSYELWPKGSGQYEWDLLMVELNADGDIVNEMHIDRVMGEKERDFYLLGQWEMMRRYMEEGPQSFPLPQVMLPIAHRRETFWEGWLVVYRSQTDPMYLAMSILGFLFPLPGLSRVLHKWIAKIPKWPDDVVIESAIDPNDPYRYEGGKNGTLIYVPPNTQFLLDLSLWAKFKIYIKNMLKKTLFREKYR